MPSYFADSNVLGFGSNTIDRMTSRQYAGCLVERVKENNDTRWEASHYFGRDFNRFRAAADCSEGKAAATYGSNSITGRNLNRFIVYAERCYWETGAF